MTCPVRRRAPSGRKPLPPEHLQYLRLDTLDTLSRERALTEAESQELERLLCADYARCKRYERPPVRQAPRTVAGTGDRQMLPAYSPTARQLDALRYVRGYQLAHNGMSPKLSEIGAAVGLRAKSGVFRLLSGLEDRNLIRRLRNREQAIEILVPVPVPQGPDGAPLYFIPISAGGLDHVPQAIPC